MIEETPAPSLYDTFMRTGTLGDVLESEEDSRSVVSIESKEAIYKKQEQQAELERQTLARKETVAVTWLRILAVAVLLIAALVCCLGVYFYTRNDEKDDFQFVFESSAERVIQSFHESVARLWGGADALSVTITSYALNTGATWPMVTMPNWDLRGANFRIMTKSVACVFVPLIQEEDRPEWEKYVAKQVMQEKVQMKSFMAEKMFIAQQDAAFGLETPLLQPPENNPLAGRNFTPSIDSMMGMPKPNGTGPYLPFFQTSPTLMAQDLPTIDIFTIPPLAPNAKHIVATNEAYLGQPHDPMVMFNMMLSQGQYRHDKTKFLGDAVTPFMYPVFDNFSHNKTMVGMLLTNVYWRLHFENILPPNAQGIVAVLSSTTNQTFTYQLDGADVTYLGPGDLHDPAYDQYEVLADMTKYLRNHAAPHTQSYTAAPMSETGVQYTIHIYPSQEMEDMYVTNKPVIYAVIVAAVFVFTSIVFVAYNTMVERRQKVVFDRAIKSTTVLSNLFPDQVKEELINSSTVPTDQRKQNARNTDAWKTANVDTAMATQPRKLAQKYSKTTILFMDIAGFSQWSSDREPEDVFELLETFYAAFDVLAVKRDVFKVETIGDCYLAVTGVPQPQPDHAFRMAKFARDCMQKVPFLTAKLSSALGRETLNLGLRVGMHSGSVTAGVLRGDKSRFQLFGNSVNMAARMESHGVKGKVHLSEATYIELVARGKAQFVVEREDPVHSKGQGVLNTYFLTNSFVNPGSATAVLSTTSTNKVGNLSTITASTGKTSVFDASESRSSGMDVSAGDDTPYATRVHGNGSERVHLSRKNQDTSAPSQNGSDRSNGNDDESTGGSAGTRSRPHWQTMVAKVDMDGSVRNGMNADGTLQFDEYGRVDV